MGRLNYRLIFSLFAAGSVLLTLLIPATRPLTQRKFWLLSGTYMTRTLASESDYISTNGTVDNTRVALLLRSYGRMSVEARAFELAKIANQRKEAALWGHVIRQTSATPISTKPSEKLSETDRLRREAIGGLELTAALEGRNLAPENGFFYLSQATALAKLGRWDEIVEPLQEGARQSQFDDYTIDVARTQLLQLYGRLNPVLPSDLGGDWSMILMPQLTNYRILSQGLGFVSSERKRMAAGLALAQIGERINRTQDMTLLKYSGSGLVSRSVRTLLNVKVASNEKAPETSTLVPKVVDRARTLGLQEVAAGWERFRDWKPYRDPSQQDYVDTYPIDVFPMTATQALFVLAWIAMIGAGLWLASQLEANFVNILTGVGIMLGVTSIGLGLVVQPWLLIGWSWGAVLLFSSFATLRLPGKKLPAAMLGLGGGLMITTASVYHDQMPLGLVLFALWLIPFAVAHFIRTAMPMWMAVGLVAIVLGSTLVIIGNGLPSSPESFERNMGGSIQTLLILTAFGPPLIAGYVMAFAKVNLSDSMRLMLRPIPFFALATAGVFLWGLRQEMQLQAAWTELTERTLPASYKRVIDEVRGEYRRY